MPPLTAHFGWVGVFIREAETGKNANASLPRLAADLLKGSRAWWRGVEVLPAAPVSGPRASLLRNNQAYALTGLQHQPGLGVESGKILVKRIKASDIHSTRQIPKPVLKICLRLPGRTLAEVVKARGRGRVRGV